jgi:hypothetical protein
MQNEIEGTGKATPHTHVQGVSGIRDNKNFSIITRLPMTSISTEEIASLTA